MEIIDKIVKSPTEPKDTNVLWLDIINDVLKYYGDNGWEKFDSVDETSTSKEEVSSIEEFDHTTPYSTGDIVRKDRKLYKFTSEHTGEWNESDVEQTSILDIAIEPAEKIGNLYDLDTQEHDTIVGAINEVNRKASGSSAGYKVLSLSYEAGGPTKIEAEITDDTGGINVYDVDPSTEKELIILAEHEMYPNKMLPVMYASGDYNGELRIYYSEDPYSVIMIHANRLTMVSFGESLDKLEVYE